MLKTPLSTVIGGAFWTPSATILGGTSKTFNQIIKSLFANGEQGFAYDPNDLSTMFQDASGTAPVTGAEQPVGLMFDKNEGLEVTNVLPDQTTFLFDPYGTTPPTTNSNTSYLGKPCVSVTFPQISDGWYTVSRAEGAYHNVMSGKFYQWRYKVALSRRLVSSESITVYVTGANGSSQTILTSTAQENVWLDGISTALVGVAGPNSLVIYAGDVISPVTMYVTDFSVNTVDIGNYAIQTTSSMRPLLVASPQHLDYDTVDDNLTTNLPAQLTGCTVVRAVPNVGTQILTNQTIPTPYNDNTDHCGLIVINRDLTATETSQITKLFNKAAGV
ncbi:hypothetical protein [Acinetobacter cumulans]|uniref:hypothetical protein n=1 Tax=Acinetobacter cumulans TaxID=2136182 RepID=UPI001443FE20|nr:hypothetical protein [Acinetobacter cumulans]